jgi:hypothetical protein
MTTYSVTVEFDDEMYAQARRRAAAEGLSLEEWLAGQLHAACAAPSPAAARMSGAAPGHAQGGDDAPRQTGGQAGEPQAPAEDAREMITAAPTVHSRLARVPAALLSAARRDPSLVEVLLFPYQPGESTGGREAAEPYPMAAEIIDLAGAWDGLHYLLSPVRRESAVPIAGDDPFSLAIYGASFGEGMPNLGYAPPGHLPAAEVAAISAALAAVSPRALREAYRPREMDAGQVYPLAWERDGERGLDYLLYYFELLRDFYTRAAAEGQAVVLCLW